MKKRKVSAVLMSAVLAVSMSMSAFAAPSSTTTNTVVESAGTVEERQAASQAAATQVLTDTATVETVTAAVAPTLTTQTVEVPVTDENGQAVTDDNGNVVTETVTETVIDTTRAGTAEAVSTTEGTTFYTQDDQGQTVEINQEDVAYHITNDSLIKSDTTNMTPEQVAAQNQVVAAIAQAVATDGTEYVTTVGFTTTDISGKVVASTVEQGTTGFSTAFNTEDAWKVLGGALSAAGVTKTQFDRNPAVYKIKSLSGTTLVDIPNIVRWVFINGRYYLMVNYEAFSSNGYVVVRDNNGTVGTTDDSFDANTTDTATYKNGTLVSDHQEALTEARTRQQPGAQGGQQPGQPGDQGMQQPGQPGAQGGQQPGGPGDQGMQQPGGPGAQGGQQPGGPGDQGMQQPGGPGDQGGQQPGGPGDRGMQQPGGQRGGFGGNGPMSPRL